MVETGSKEAGSRALMDLVFTPEHEALRAATRDLLARHGSEQAVRAAMEADSGYDPELWRRMAEVGLQGLAVPEEFGSATCTSS